MAKKVERPLVPEAWVRRIGATLLALPEVYQEAAWVGTRWRIRGRTIAHVYGGEDQRFRITLRGDPDEVAAFEHLGDPYFRLGWADNGIGLLLDEATDWGEVAELVTDSYCVQAPPHLAARVDRPQGGGDLPGGLRDQAG
jgi:hypothetical protein